MSYNYKQKRGWRQWREWRTYEQLLGDSRWQKKRAEILKRDGYSCKQCGAKNTILHVHHLSYGRTKYPWDVSDSQLTTLCEECHKKVHGRDSTKELQA